MPMKPWQEVASHRKWATRSSNAEKSRKARGESRGWNWKGGITGDLDKSSFSEVTQNLFRAG